MPPPRVPTTLHPAWLVVPGVALAGAAILFPAFGLVLAVGAGVYAWFARRSLLHWRKVRTERSGDSICAFSRALPARGHDTWIVRAVYEELSRDRDVPVRPGDRLEQDLGFLWEDFEICLEEIARRAGRSLARCEDNPLYGCVYTVADVVAFLERQPKG